MRFVARMMIAALAQPFVTPTLPDLLPENEPSSSPSPSPTKPPSGGGGGGNGGNTGGGNTGGGTTKPGDTPGDVDRPGKKRGGKGRGADEVLVPNLDYNRIGGAYSTDRLVTIAARLRALGWSEQRIARRVYAPFIVAGPANWIDTWGAPRYGPGPIVRTHEGQDVFCEFGAPVIATEDGTIEFDEQDLGGLIARLHTGGSYWYYAHLSHFNDELRSGQRVRAGDVIGYCGNTGNALTTPPHVHFGWYGTGGGARNPMESLIAWLATAEARAASLLDGATGERVERIETLTAARRFGDAFTPDLSELDIAGESLLASGSAPGTGAFALAEAALQMALVQVDTPEAAAVAAQARAAGHARDHDHASHLPARSYAGESGD